MLLHVSIHNTRGGLTISHFCEVRTVPRTRCRRSSFARLAGWSRRKTGSTRLFWRPRRVREGWEWTTSVAFLVIVFFCCCCWWCIIVLFVVGFFLLFAQVLSWLSCFIYSKGNSNSLRVINISWSWNYLIGSHISRRWKRLRLFCRATNQDNAAQGLATKILTGTPTPHTCTFIRYICYNVLQVQQLANVFM